MAIGTGLPSRACLEANAQALAHFAALCQESGLVPLLQPEILGDGDHTLKRCSEVAEETLHAVFAQLGQKKVLLEGMLLKANMILPGSARAEKVAVAAVAEATVKCLLSAVPPAVPGIVFLSGGQLAAKRLNAMNALFQGNPPWALTFAFGRAIQQPVLEVWRGQQAQFRLAQDALYDRVKSNQMARSSFYLLAMNGR